MILEARFRRSLESIYVPPQEEWLWGRSAGSFPVQRLVIDNLVPRAYSFEIQFQREEPWKRGWEIEPDDTRTRVQFWTICNVLQLAIFCFVAQTHLGGTGRELIFRSDFMDESHEQIESHIVCLCTKFYFLLALRSVLDWLVIVYLAWVACGLASFNDDVRGFQAISDRSGSFCAVHP